MAAAVAMGSSARVALLVSAFLLLANTLPEAQGAKVKLPKAVNLSFPPYTSALNCSLASAVTPAEFVCSLQRNGTVVFFSYDSVISARYAYNKKVQLYKKNTKYAASFSTSYVVEFSRSSERREDENFDVFGGGFVFAITPDQKVGDSGAESLGLFEVDEASGKSLRGKKTKTVAMGFDLSRQFPWDFSEVPHFELDINSVDSVVETPLWSREAFFDRKLAVFVDYDARKEFLTVRIQNLTDTGEPDKKQAKLYISYSLNLADYVTEKSVVGFSSRVPEGQEGAYGLYNWKFSTKWVQTKRLQ